MNRGLAGQRVFVSERDTNSFLNLFEDTWRRWSTRVFAYCFMETHYHLAIQTPQGNLQRVMRHINGVYTQNFNRRHTRDGPLFRGRYKAILVDAEVYLAAVVRYIHLNPVEAKKAKDPMDYRWSSHQHYLKPKTAPPWLSLNAVLPNYGSPADFHRFVLSGNQAALTAFYESNRRSPMLGDEAFTSRIREGDYAAGEEHVVYERTILKPEVSSVMRAVGEIYSVSEPGLLRGKRGQKNEGRQVAMYLIRELCDRSLKEIADMFSLGSYGGVGAACSVIERRATYDQVLKHRIEQIRERVRAKFMQKKT
jgi:REP element-mobilizing transposase RayT